MKEKLEFNRWICDDSDPKWLAYFDNVNNVIYGFGSDGDWFLNKKDKFSNPNNCKSTRCATDDEVLNRMTIEAERLGLEEGIEVKSLYDNITRIVEDIHPEMALKTYFWINGKICIMKDGIWAKPIEQPKKEFKIDGVMDSLNYAVDYLHGLSNKNKEENELIKLNCPTKEEINPKHYSVKITNAKNETIECDFFDIANALNLSLEQCTALRYFRVKGNVAKQINDTEKGIKCLKRHIDKLKIKNR